MMLACLLMVGCQEEELVPDYGEGTGTLIISGLEVETVVGDIQTRASVNETDIPEEFTIVLVNTADNTPDILEEGTHKANVATASRLKQMGFSVEDIQKATGLSEEEIREL